MDLDYGDEELWWHSLKPTDTLKEITGPLYHLNIATNETIEYAIPLFGYVFPILFIIILVTNTLVVVALSKPHMRSPMNAVFIVIALCNILTALFPAPWFLYMYTFGNHYKPLTPAVACYCYYWMWADLPSLFHTVSIWLTLALAVQRYIYICHPATALTWCTMPRVLKGIAWTFVAAILHESAGFVDFAVIPEEITWKGKLPSPCLAKVADWVVEWLEPGSPEVYFSYYYLIRVILVHLCPAASLIVLNILLLREMRKSQLKRQQLVKDNMEGSEECQNLMNSYSTTLMLFVVITVFLGVHVPKAVLSIVHVIFIFTENLVNYHLMDTLFLINNFLIYVSFPMNFAIYCCMSRQFRATFKALFVWGARTATKDGYRPLSYSLVSESTCTNETVL